MENTTPVSNLPPIHLLPEVKDITTVHMTGQGLLLKPHTAEIVTTKSGLIIAGGDTETIRGLLLQTGTVISTGSGVSNIKPGNVVMYYNSASEGMLRSYNETTQKDDIYFMVSEYNIKAILN